MIKLDGEFSISAFVLPSKVAEVAVGADGVDPAELSAY
jgi:hypothetical protein